MNVLIIGSGGREHALGWAIAKSPLLTKLYAAPGNAGIAELAECVDIKADDIDGLLGFIETANIDFVVVGPEAPLVAGLVDRLDEAGVKAFGPNANAAEIEGSKGMMKDLCGKYNVPTADYARFDEPDAAKEYIRAHGAPIVVKADGLAAGKGVIVCRNENEAYAAIDHIMIETAFGDAGAEVVIEQMMVGEEASFFALVDGTRAIPMGAAQDHKAAFDGDEGPNTGGMGAYSPAPIITDELSDIIMKTIINPVIEGMAHEGRPYKGVLFAGFMITDEGPKVIEFNCRFGDPECQALMMRIQSDVLEALQACAEGRLDEISLKWSDQSALCVVMANKGYPDYYEKGSQINNLEAASADPNTVIFHAGTELKDGQLLAIGGRVLGVTAAADNIKLAQAKAYKSVDAIDWDHGFCRRDIGWRAATG